MPQSRGASLSILVLPAGPADAEALAHVHVASWRQTYRGMLPEAFLARMSEADFARRFRRALTRPGPNDVTLLALAHDGPIGYVQGGPSRFGGAAEAEIATLYVLRAGQGRSVGRGLITGAARALAAQGAASLALSVLRDNVSARGFYERLGGEAEPPRVERGPGGALLQEVLYRWPDIRRLTG
jgi:ribosomal protein S18 acetylase RimI-like enzyme